MKKIVLVFLIGLMLTLVSSESSCQNQEHYYVHVVEQVKVPIERRALRYESDRFSKAISHPDSLILVDRLVVNKMTGLTQSVIEVTEIFVVYQDGMIRVVESAKDPVESKSYFIIGVILYVIIISLITIFKKPPKFTGWHIIILVPAFAIMIFSSHVVTIIALMAYMMYLLFRERTPHRSLRTENKYVTLSSNLRAEKIEFLAVLFITATMAIVASFFTMVIKL